MPLTGEQKKANDRARYLRRKQEREREAYTQALARKVPTQCTAKVKDPYEIIIDREQAEFEESFGEDDMNPDDWDPSDSPCWIPPDYINVTRDYFIADEDKEEWDPPTTLVTMSHGVIVGDVTGELTAKWYGSWGSE